jgi:hypothetical protein
MGEPEACLDCGNRRFRFLTGKIQIDPIDPAPPPSWYGPVTSSEFAEAIAEGSLTYEQARERMRNIPVRKLMEYVDTRTGPTWWEPYDAIDFKVMQLKDFSGL